MSHSPALGLYKPLKLQAILSETKTRFCAHELIEDAEFVFDIPNLTEMVKLLDPPLERIVVTRTLGRYLHLIAISPRVSMAARSKAVELAMARRRRIPGKLFLALFEEFYDRASVRAYLNSRYSEDERIGVFQKQTLLSPRPAEAFQSLLFNHLGIRLRQFHSESGLNQRSRLATEILALQCERPSAAWLESTGRTDVEDLLELHSEIERRFHFFGNWMERLCGSLPLSRAKLQERPPAAALLEAFTRPERMGSPLDATLRWAKAPEKLRVTAQLYYFEQALDDFFGSDSDHERFDFWKNYANVCQGLERFGRQNAFALKIGKLWFIEFVPTGACYIYGENDFQFVRNHGSGDLKWKDRCFKGTIDVVNASGSQSRISPPLSHVNRGRGGSNRWQQQFDGFIRKHAL